MLRGLSRLDLIHSPFKWLCTDGLSFRACRLSRSCCSSNQNYENGYHYLLAAFFDGLIPEVTRLANFFFILETANGYILPQAKGNAERGGRKCRKFAVNCQKWS